MNADKVSDVLKSAGAWVGTSEGIKRVQDLIVRNYGKTATGKLKTRIFIEVKHVVDGKPRPVWHCIAGNAHPTDTLSKHIPVDRGNAILKAVYEMCANSAVVQP